jgi:hemolysin activation/secretion protein
MSLTIALRGSRAAAAVTLILASVLPIASAWAQAQPGVVNKPSARELDKPEYLPPPAEEPEFELPPVVEPQPAPVPVPQAEGLPVDGFAFEGNRVVPTAVLEKIAQPYAGRKVSSAELEELRQALSRYYVDNGYINSGALLVDGFYRDRIVHFKIVEGRVSEIRAQGLGRLRQSYLTQRLLRPDEPLNVNTLQERFQLLLIDPLFAKVNVRLEPGAEPGSSILDIDVTRARPWDFSIYYNNYQPPSIGAEAFGFAGVVRNLTGLGDTLDFSCQQGEAGIDKGSRCGGGWQVPIVYRTEVHARFDYGESSVLEEPVAALGVRSRIQSVETGVSHAFIDSMTQRLALGLSYAHRENRTFIGDTLFPFIGTDPAGISKVNDWRFEQDYTHRWERRALALRSTLTWGRTNVLLGQPQQQDYFFWVGQAQATQQVMENGASVLIRGNLQWTRDRLVPLEQIALGGVASVRGYRENQLVRDQGYYVNLEFRYPLFERERGQHRLYIVPFFDYGEGWNTGSPRERLSSLGVGLNYQLRGFYADLYYGKQLIHPEIETSGNLQDDGFHFQVRYQF